MTCPYIVTSSEGTSHCKLAASPHPDVVKLREALSFGLRHAKLDFPTLTVTPPIDTRQRFIEMAEQVLAETEPKGE